MAGIRNTMIMKKICTDLKDYIMESEFCIHIFSDRVNKNLSTLFKDRGSRNDKPDLYWLKNTNSAAVSNVRVCSERKAMQNG